MAIFSGSDESHVEKSSELMSTMIISIGIVSLVISLFYGIKLKWFRYRLSFPSTNEETNSVMMRSHSVTEIRENCSTGIYRQSTPEEILITSDNEFNSTSIRSPSPSNVKLKGSNQSSIFRWPFRSKMSLSRSTSHEGSSNRISTVDATFRQNTPKEQDSTAEKNERLRRSIYERLNSSNSMSMPDLVQCEDSKFNEREIAPEPMLAVQESAEISLDEDSTVIERQPEPILAIQRGVVVSLDEASNYHTVNEIQEISAPIRAKIVPLRQNEELEEVVEEMDVDIPPRPPTPIRRRSRSNSLKPIENKEVVQPEQNVPPPIIPRKRNINYNIEADQSDSSAMNEIIKQNEDVMTPKSILKTQKQQDNIQQLKTNVQFINVPDSSSEDEDYQQDSEVDVWHRIDAHRDMLTRKYDLSLDSPKHSPPPLPKTPPPTAESEQRDFSFA